MSRGSHNLLFGSKNAPLVDAKTRAAVEQADVAARQKHLRKQIAKQHTLEGGTVSWNDFVDAYEWKDKDGALHRLDGPAIESTKQGQGEWFVRGMRHRADGPAVVYDNQEEWYIKDYLHRDGAPAVIGAKGQNWYQHGVLHRDGGPAIENTDGSYEWHQQGFRHREGGPAVVQSNGKKMWLIRGYLHREDGPAVIESNRQEYRWYDQRHRLDGPAVEYSDGRTEYWVGGIQCSKEDAHNPASVVRSRWANNKTQR